VSASAAVIRVKCFREIGRSAAKQFGGSTSRLLLDQNPIVMPCSQTKTDLRKAGERRIPRLRRCMARSPARSPPAKPPKISGTQAMREIHRNLL
jgi:hypothetical protein